MGGCGPRSIVPAALAVVGAAALVVLAKKAKKGGDGSEGQVFVIRGDSGLEVHVTPTGAAVTKVVVPTPDGPLDVCLGLPSASDYSSRNEPYFGVVIGRVANRIRDASFELNGMNYLLEANQPPNSLHGGGAGAWHDKPWTVSKVTDASIVLTRTSPDGEGGYPGEVKATVTYEVMPDNRLRTMLEATCDTETPVNMAHHAYWNLAGHSAGPEALLDHEMRILADTFTPTDPKTLLPTGAVLAVAGKPVDFTRKKAIGDDIRRTEKGFDHTFVLRGAIRRAGSAGMVGHDGPLRKAAELRYRERGVDVYTTAPAMQVYSGNFIGGTKGKDGVTYKDWGGVALETMGYPDAVHFSSFPSIVIGPGKPHRQVIVHHFL
ncbi:unnamed protein product [Pedinophyceae sp. YPF-701]|nr:unnamed protein product [Pedinophyceae sp. YPF-701]